jgi:hypothetical protein
VPQPRERFVVVQQVHYDENKFFRVPTRERALHMRRHLRLLYRNFPVAIHRLNNSKEKSSGRIRR